MSGKRFIWALHRFKTLEIDLDRRSAEQKNTHSSSIPPYHAGCDPSVASEISAFWMCHSSAACTLGFNTKRCALDPWGFMRIGRDNTNMGSSVHLQWVSILLIYLICIDMCNV